MPDKKKPSGRSKAGKPTIKPQTRNANVGQRDADRERDDEGLSPETHDATVGQRERPTRDGGDNDDKGELA